jgi:hypothetical protein
MGVQRNRVHLSWNSGSTILELLLNEVRPSFAFKPIAFARDQ